MEMRVSPAYIVLAGIIGGLIYTFWIKGKNETGERRVESEKEDGEIKEE